MKGRKPTPSAIRLLQGNPGKRPIKDSVKFPVEALPPPDFLQDHALEEWNRMEPVLRGGGIVTVADRMILAAYCSTYGDFREACKQLEELPREDRIVTERPDGMGGHFPPHRDKRQVLARARDEYRRDMTRFAAELGATPSARTKVTPVVRPDKSNKFAAIRKTE